MRAESDEQGPTGRRRSRIGFACVLALVAALSWLAREVNHRTTHVPGRAGWVTPEVDSHHMLRRVERIFREGLPVAERDRYLDFPNGAAIPAPPYYPLSMWALLAPFAPSDGDARHEWLEMRMASLPMLFGVLTSLVVAWIGRRLAGNVAGLFAGAYHALCSASVVYASRGIADFHALITFLNALAILGFVLALERGALERPRAALAFGAGIGAVLGLAMGCWAASIVHFAALELALGFLILAAARREVRGLPWLGVSIHVVALLVLAPAIASSPWRESHPWMVINLSWFQVAYLLLAASVFVPLFVLRPGTSAIRAYPWAVAAALAALGAYLAFGSSPAGAGLREGFAWASRVDKFMAVVSESQPLFGEGARIEDGLAYVGYGLVLLPLAWLALVRRAWLGDRRVLLLAVASAIAAAQTLRQTRFGESLGMSMGLVLAVAGADLARSARPVWWAAVGARLRALPVAVGGALALAVALGLNATTTVTTAQRGVHDLREPWDPVAPVFRAGREACEWLRERTPATEDYGVMAMWNWGHTLTWAADRPVVSANYGIYLGAESYYEPPLFLLESDAAAAEARLSRRSARYVLATTELHDHFELMARMVEDRTGAKLPRSPRDPSMHDLSTWRASVARALVNDGVLRAASDDAGRPLGFLRLVFASSIHSRRWRGAGNAPTVPAALVWERVLGARIEARGAPGDVLSVALTVLYGADRAEGAHALTFLDRAAVGDDGVARLRVPYATDARNGDGEVAPGARWSIGDRSGALTIPERAVLEGELVELR